MEIAKLGSGNILAERVTLAGGSSLILSEYYKISLKLEPSTRTQSIIDQVHQSKIYRSCRGVKREKPS